MIRFSSVCGMKVVVQIVRKNDVQDFPVVYARSIQNSSRFGSDLRTSGRCKDLIELRRCGHRRLAVEVTSCGAVWRSLEERWLFFPADRHHVRAAIGKLTPRRTAPRSIAVGHVRNLVLESPGLLGIRLRDGTDQQAGIGMYRRLDDPFYIASFGNRPPIEDDNVLAHLIGCGEVMGDVDERDPKAPTQVS